MLMKKDSQVFTHSIFIVEKEEETYETYEEEVVKREEKPKEKVKEKAK